MNGSKTTLKGDANKKVMQANGSGFATSTKTIVMVVVAAILIIAIIGGLIYDNFKPRTEFTIDGEKVTMTDLMYYAYQAEAQYSYMDQIYQQFYGSSYWDMTSQSDSSKTNREAAKEELVNTYKQIYVLYQQALDKGYKINAKDKKTAEKEVKSTRKNLSMAQKGLAGLTKGSLTKVLQMKACAERYKQDLIDSFDIDDDKLIAGVKKADYRQYDVQYYSIPITSTNSKGKETKASKKDLAAYEKELTELAEKAKTEDFDKLTPQAKNSSKSDDAKATATPDKDNGGYKSTFTSDGKFVAGDGTFTTDVEKVLKKMKNDEISTVIKGKSAYYLVKMTNNNDSEAYDQQCKKVVQDEETSKFNDWYDKLKDKYKVKMNDKEWDKLTMGEIVINK